MSADLPDADRVAEAARSVPGVTGLGGGAAGAVATYLPGRRVPGVRIDDEVVAVHVTVSLDRPLMRVAASVRAAVSPLAYGRAVDVVIEDVEVDEDVATAPDAIEATAPG